jgi:hypothetical protein
MRNQSRDPTILGMAILTSFKVPGDPHDVLHRTSNTFGEIAIHHGALAHIIVNEGDGIRVFDLWETEEAMHHTSNPSPATHQERRQWDVLQHEINP